MSETQRQLDRWTLMKIWIRLFFLQASWNYETMQGLGVAYAVLPGLRRLYPPQELPGVVADYSQYFNTHPYMTPSVLGTALKLQQEMAQGVTIGISPRQYSEMVMAPYAAIGDALFWGGLRPLAAVLSLYLAFLGVLWAPLVFFVAQAIPHLWMIGMGFYFGLRHGLLSVERIQQWKLSDKALQCKQVTMFALGGFGALLAVTGLEKANVSGVWAPGVLLSIAPMVYLMRRGVPPLLMVVVLVGAWACLYWSLTNVVFKPL